MMLKKSFGATTLAVVLFCAVCVNAQIDSDQVKIQSSLCSDAFVQLSQKLVDKASPTTSDASIASVFVMASYELTAPNQILNEMIDVAELNQSEDYSEQVLEGLLAYADRAKDLQPIRRAVNYLVGQKNTRDQREKLLESLLGKIGQTNSILSSDFSTELGLMAAEKADVDSASYYFTRAYNENPYNLLAFDKLAETSPEAVVVPVYAQHLRRMLAVDPYNLEIALEFASFCSRYEMFSLASAAYEYSAKLFQYYEPTELLPETIYLNWLICTYNESRSEQKCLSVISFLDKAGISDYRIDYIKAVCQPDQNGSGVDNLSSTLETSVKAGDKLSKSDLAFYYGVMLGDNQKSLEMANLAYSTNSDDAFTKQVFAFALALNGQVELASELTSEDKEGTPLSMLTSALTIVDKKEQVAKLKEVANRHRASFEANFAVKKIKEYGSEFISKVDPDVLAETLSVRFKTVVPTFKKPEEAVSLKVNTNGSDFTYGSAIDATLVVKNLSQMPIIVSNESWVMGYVRVDAQITGDLEIDLPVVKVKRFLPLINIEPGTSSFVQLELMQPALTRVLRQHPQANLNINFKVYIDPVEQLGGGVESRISGLEPVSFSVKRNGVQLTRQYLIQRLDVLENGQKGQKLRSIELLAGLLAEQQNMNATGAKYRFKATQPELLTSALARSISVDEWDVRLAATMALSDINADFTATNAISQNLSHENWPLRMASLYVLSQNQSSDFTRVLKWSRKSDKNGLVQELATAILE